MSCLECIFIRKVGDRRKRWCKYYETIPIDCDKIKTSSTENEKS